ncbi:MAG: hypothetical protein IPK27_07860 [Rhodanobacteraceae bacterium]|nr:hypothetical protein [Rhodanobacteraceae bacterium]
MRYVQGNVVVENAELRSRLIGPNGLAMSGEHPGTRCLTVGYDGAHPVSFASGTLPAGAYSLISEVWSGGLLAEAGAACNRGAGGGATAVGGAWQLPESVLPAGSAATIHFEVQHRRSGTVRPVRARARRRRLK